MSTHSLDADSRDIQVVRDVFSTAPEVAIVLGSGLSAVADAVEDAAVVAYGELPGFPFVGEVAGHAGRLITGRVGGTPTVVFQGRVHAYQGVAAFDAAYPARLAAALGCDTFIVTNAAGGLDPSFAPGDLMLITDHINLTGDNPLVGWSGPEGGTPFVPMGKAYDPALVTLAVEVGSEMGLEMHQGVYAGVLGPSYETPAEVAMLSGIGAHAVGMSTVPEVIVARALGMRVLGLSLIANVAGGHEISHEEVLAAGARAAASLVDLLPGILGRLEA